jgi:hypothetical protein
MGTTPRAVLCSLLLLGLAGPTVFGQGAAAREGAASLAGRAVIEGERVRLYLPAGEVSGAEHHTLFRELDAAVAEIAPRVPVEVESPLTVAIELDYPALARATGRLEPAVATRVPVRQATRERDRRREGPSAEAAAEVHLVLHSDDLYAVRHAVAGALLARAGLSARLPPWFERGAALWLSGDWFGRPYEQWLGPLARAHALPSEAQLLAPEEQLDGSAPLWTPAAAAMVGGLRGETVAAKLARVPGEAAVRALLWRIEARALGLSTGVAGPDRVAGPDGAVERASPTLRTAPASPPPSGSARPPEPPPRPFLHGVSLAMLNRIDGGYHAPSVDDALDRLEALGADAVALMPFAYQRDPRRPEMAYLNRHPASETDAGVVHAARRARERGLAVLWKPHLWISHESWPGEVAMATEADWRAWWEGYRRFVLHQAFLAAWTGADLLAVGVELDRTLVREREWRELIAAVRVLYPGPLTYAANWHEGAEEVGFWDALDFAGVDAYYPLAASHEAGPAELARGARGVAERLRRLAETSRRPVLLTEVGFAARRAAWVAPHREGGELSEADQAAAYRALLDALGKPRWLAGAFFWKAFSAPLERDGSAGGERPDFRFLDRPAEHEVRRWFAEPR